MDNNGIEYLPLKRLDVLQLSNFITVNEKQLVHILDDVEGIESLDLLKSKIMTLKKVINCETNDENYVLDTKTIENKLSLRRDIFVSELEQILESHTITRAQYYLKRLKSSIQVIKTSKINDINLLRWKDYDSIITDSLWVLDK